MLTMPPFNGTHGADTHTREIGQFPLCHAVAYAVLAQRAPQHAHVIVIHAVSCPQAAIVPPAILPPMSAPRPVFRRVVVVRACQNGFLLAVRPLAGGRLVTGRSCRRSLASTRRVCWP